MSRERWACRWTENNSDAWKKYQALAVSTVAKMGIVSGDEMSAKSSTDFSSQPWIARKLTLPKIDKEVKPKSGAMTAATAWRLMSDECDRIKSSLVAELGKKWDEQIDEVRRKFQKPPDENDLLKLAALQISQTEHLARRLFASCCRAWGKRGFEESPAFLQAIWGNSLLPLLDDRKSTIFRTLNRMAARRNITISHSVTSRVSEMIEGQIVRIRLLVESGTQRIYKQVWFVQSAPPQRRASAKRKFGPAPFVETGV